jgi:CRISPR-associated protein Cas2
MAAEQRFYVVSYDIPSASRRVKIANILLGYGARVQFSVFECQLDTAQEHALWRKLERVIKPAEDSVRYYNLGVGGAMSVTVQGKGKVEVLPAVLIV